MNNRYPDQAEQRWMSMVQQLFLLMYNGRSNTLLVNGHMTAQVADTNTVDAFTAFSTSSATSLPDYVRETYQLDSLYIHLDTSGVLEGIRQWARSDLNAVGLFQPGRQRQPLVEPGFQSGIQASCSS